MKEKKDSLLSFLTTKQFLEYPFKKTQHLHALPHCMSGCLNIIPYRKWHKCLERVFLSLTLTTL